MHLNPDTLTRSGHQAAAAQSNRRRAFTLRARSRGAMLVRPPVVGTWPIVATEPPGPTDHRPYTPPVPRVHDGAMAATRQRVVPLPRDFRRPSLPGAHVRPAGIGLVAFPAMRPRPRRLAPRTAQTAFGPIMESFALQAERWRGAGTPPEPAVPGVPVGVAYARVRGIMRRYPVGLTADAMPAHDHPASYCAGWLVTPEGADAYATARLYAAGAEVLSDMSLTDARLALRRSATRERVRRHRERLATPARERDGAFVGTADEWARAHGVVLPAMDDHKSAASDDPSGNDRPRIPVTGRKVARTATL